MRKIQIFFILFLFVSNLLAQTRIPVAQIDSILTTDCISENDWAITLSIEQAGTIPFYDSLGNIIDGDPKGTFLLLKIGENHFLQKLCFDYSNYISEPVLIIGQRQKLSKEINITYSTDSINLTGMEWIYPFIYKEDNVYILQSPANHEPYYGMYFKTLKYDSYPKYFTETDLTEKLRYMDFKNLNYTYNSSTFTYRVFCKLQDLIITHKKSISSSFSCF